MSYLFMHQGIPDDKGGGPTSDRETAYYGRPAVRSQQRCARRARAEDLVILDMEVIALQSGLVHILQHLQSIEGSSVTERSEFLEESIWT